MISMQGVPSSLIARNESWVRKQASALARRLPSNVEKADLIQAGLIAVAQAALGFEWDGDHDSEEGKEAFVRYARMRVKGAMLDELRQMDQMGRAQRRKVKVVQIARERWRASHQADPTLAELSTVCGMPISEISQLEQAALMAQSGSLTSETDGEEHMHAHEPATPQDEVEARVDTAIVMRRLEKFFSTLPPRDRQVIDSYLGVGMTPIELAGSLKVSPSRVSQLYKSVCERVAKHFGNSDDQRAADRAGDPALAAREKAERFEALVAQREAELADSAQSRPWGELMEAAFTMPRERFGSSDSDERIEVTSSTRWG
ncbi:hypothetical protein BH11PSE8_BH11PSE8_38530 [soil metagenome]